MEVLELRSKVRRLRQVFKKILELERTNRRTSPFRV
jgi:hypothetical protein